MAEARAPRFQMGKRLAAPGATIATRILRGARSAAMDRAIETRVRLSRQRAGQLRLVDRDKCAPIRLKMTAAVVVHERSG